MKNCITCIVRKCKYKYIYHKFNLINSKTIIISIFGLLINKVFRHPEIRDEQ